MRISFQKSALGSTSMWLVYTTSPMLRQTEYNFTKEKYLKIKKELLKLFPGVEFHFSVVADKNWGHIHIEFLSDADEAQFLLIASSGITI